MKSSKASVGGAPGMESHSPVGQFVRGCGVTWPTAKAPLMTSNWAVKLNLIIFAGATGKRALDLEPRMLAFGNRQRGDDLSIHLGTSNRCH